jgi:uncharacterized protein YdaU (DUF1376 family)
MAKSAPYFPFYPDDWLDDESIFDMGLECEGAYIRLLAAMWKRGGSLNNDPYLICNILRCKPAKWKKIKAILIDYKVIILEDDRLFNERLTKELHFFNEKSQKNSQNANKRWKNEASPTGKKPNKINDSPDAVALQPQCHTDTDLDTDTDLKEKDKKKQSPLAMLTGMNVDQAIAAEWLKVRKLKKLAATQTAFNAAKKQADIAGIDFNAAIKLCVEESWGGFKAEWLVNKKGANNGTQRNQAIPGQLTGASARTVAVLERIKHM